MRRVIWTQAARSDLQKVRDYVGQFSPLAAVRMSNRLLSAADTLAEFADRGRAIGAERRELTIIPPYLIRYRITPDTIYVLRVRHGARRPT